MEIPRWAEWVCEGARGPSTAAVLRIRDALPSLRMTELDMGAQDDRSKNHFTIGESGPAGLSSSAWILPSSSA